MRLLLARHSECQANVDKLFAGNEPSPLTRKGREQAYQLGQTAIEFGVETIHTSTLARARRTARIAGAVLGIDHDHIILSPLLRERDYGPFSGQKISEVTSSGIGDFGEIAGVETPKQLFARTVDALAVIEATRTTTDSAMAITHGSNVKIIRAALTGYDMGTYYRLPSVDNIETMPLIIEAFDQELVVTDPLTNNTFIAQPSPGSLNHY